VFLIAAAFCVRLRLVPTSPSPSKQKPTALSTFFPIQMTTPVLERIPLVQRILMFAATSPAAPLLLQTVTSSWRETVQPPYGVPIISRALFGGGTSRALALTTFVDVCCRSYPACLVMLAVQAWLTCCPCISSRQRRANASSSNRSAFACNNPRALVKNMHNARFGSSLHAVVRRAVDDSTTADSIELLEWMLERLAGVDVAGVKDKDGHDLLMCAAAHSTQGMVAHLLTVKQRVGPRRGALAFGVQPDGGAGDAPGTMSRVERAVDVAIISMRPENVTLLAAELSRRGASVWDSPLAYRESVGAAVVRRRMHETRVLTSEQVARALAVVSTLLDFAVRDTALPDGAGRLSAFAAAFKSGFDYCFFHEYLPTALPERKALVETYDRWRLQLFTVFVSFAFQHRDTLPAASTVVRNYIERNAPKWRNYTEEHLAVLRAHGLAAAVESAPTAYKCTLSYNDVPLLRLLFEEQLRRHGGDRAAVQREIQRRLCEAVDDDAQLQFSCWFAAHEPHGSRYLEDMLPPEPIFRVLADEIGIKVAEIRGERNGSSLLHLACAMHSLDVARDLDGKALSPTNRIVHCLVEDHGMVNDGNVDTAGRTPMAVACGARNQTAIHELVHDRLAVRAPMG
jgi:hypothetical protein